MDETDNPSSLLRAYTLFQGTWQINRRFTRRWVKSIDIIPKIVAILLPALVLGLVQVPGVSHQHIVYLVLCDFTSKSSVRVVSA